jgi:hypothetical protein
MNAFRISNGLPNVAGATLGQEHLNKVLGALNRIVGDPGEIVVLDFEGTETATASYMKATVLALLRQGREGAEGGFLNLIFPVVANLSAEVAEELDQVLIANRLPCIEALTLSSTRVQRGRVRGVLDAALGETLAALVSEGAASATQLFETRRKEVPISVTGWNNRLAELHRFRLAWRRKHGRQWVYEPITEEVIRG